VRGRAIGPVGDAAAVWSALCHRTHARPPGTTRRRPVRQDRTVSDQAPADVDAAVTELYRGPPESFVAGRDELARVLRQAKRRDEAAAVKALRRPSRVAWAFNAALGADADLAARLDAAVVGVTAAQEGTGNVRTASAALRSVVGDLVDAAVRTAGEAGHPLDRSTLTPGALAVVGDPEARDALLAGRLGDVPAGGGFGFGLEAPAERAPRARPAAERPGRAATPARRAPAHEGAGTGELAGARRAVSDAEGEAALAAEAVGHAERALAEARASVDEADDRRAAAQRAVAEAEERRDAAERAVAEAEHGRRQAEADLDAARSRQRDASEAVASARAALSKLGA
jgi:hypothetical protein